MQRCSDAGSVFGAPDGARSGLPARAPPSDPRCRGASQRTLRQIMQSPGAPSQTRGARTRKKAATKQPRFPDGAALFAVHLGNQAPQPRGNWRVELRQFFAKPLFADGADLINCDFSFAPGALTLDAAAPAWMKL